MHSGVQENPGRYDNLDYDNDNDNDNDNENGAIPQRLTRVIRITSGICGSRRMMRARCLRPRTATRNSRVEV